MGQWEMKHTHVVVLTVKVKGLSVLLKMPMFDMDIPQCLDLAMALLKYMNLST